MQRIITKIGLCILWVLNLLPNRLTLIIGTILGYLAYYCLSTRRNIGIKNLSLCFPDMTNKTKHKIIKQHFQHLVISGLHYSVVFYASEKKIKQMVQIKNLEYLIEHYEKTPVILLLPHFVGLELGAIRTNLEIVGYSLYSQQKNTVINNILKKARLRFTLDKGGKIFSRQEGLRPIIKLLRETKRVFGYFPDQDFGEKDSMFLPFFAYPNCATVTVLPKLVQLTNAVVVPMVVTRVGGKYIIEFFKAWDNYPTGNLTHDVERMNQFIESVVLKNISQYFWLHKRFKTHPTLPRGAVYNNS